MPDWQCESPRSQGKLQEATKIVTEIRAEQRPETVMEAVASWTLSKEREEGIKQAAPAHVKSRDGPGMASAEAAPVSQGEILQIDSPPPNHGHVKLVSFVGSEDEVCPARGRADTVATSHVATAEVVPSADPFLQLLRALRMDDEEDVAVFRVAGVRNTRDLLELEEDDLKHDDLMLMPLMTRKKLQRFVSQPMQEKQKLVASSGAPPASLPQRLTPRDVSPARPRTHHGAGVASAMLSSELDLEASEEKRLATHKVLLRMEKMEWKMEKLQTKMATDMEDLTGKMTKALESLTALLADGGVQGRM